MFWESHMSEMIASSSAWIFAQLHNCSLTLTTLPFAAEINYLMLTDGVGRGVCSATVPLTWIQLNLLLCHQHAICNLKMSYKPASWLFIKPALSWQVAKHFVGVVWIWNLLILYSETAQLGWVILTAVINNLSDSTPKKKGGGGFSQKGRLHLT